MTENKTLKVYGDGAWINDTIRSSYEDADIVVLPGGTDVAPCLYGQMPIPQTHFDIDVDRREMAFMDKCVKDGKFIVAICKASQMATVYMGGSLIQHMQHGSRHVIVTNDGNSFTVNSSHHQMSYPYDLPDTSYELMAWAQQQSPVHLVENSRQLVFPTKALDQDELFKEPEVIWYPSMRCLAIQSHPEWGSCSKEAEDWMNSHIKRLYNDTLSMSASA